MILYIENLKDSIRKLLEIVSEFSKITGYKINTQKSLAFLYTNNEKSEREMKESIPFTVTTKRIKYLGINLPKYIMRNAGLEEAQAGIKIALAIQGLLCFHMNCETLCSSSVKNAIGN